MATNPQVRYTKSADGVHIAYWTLGDGPPIVYLPATPFSHVQLEWDMPECRRWYERLVAAGHTLVRYDARGTGLSDRDVDDFTLEAYVRDLDTVIGALGLEKVALFATADMGCPAIAWASANPERVSQLILWCSWANRASVSGTPQTKSLRALVEHDWVTYTETAARVIMGWSNAPGEASRFAEFYRGCTSQETVLKSIDTIYGWDVRDQLAKLQCPVLVMQPREMPTLSADVARRMAIEIPQATLLLLEGRSPVPFLGDSTQVLRAITQFLGGDQAAAQVAEAASGGSVTILFTDMEGSTAITQRLGDDAAQQIVRAHNRIVRDALTAHGGTEVKHTGDGLMVSFHSATQAIECAIQIQQQVAAYGEEHPESPLRVRCGINTGEPVAEHGDYFGTAVQLAARICQLCDPGTILVSSVVRDLTAGRRFLFSDRGEQLPRGFEDPVRLYEVRWSS
jgi:class 3 adenylate cyclase/alpha-beta hydrolase superfamily lysophospholipase